MSEPTHHPNATRTTEQREILKERAVAFIEHCVDEFGYPPSVAELGEHLGYASKASTHFLLVDLQREGRIVRHPKVARGLQVTVATVDDPAEEGSANPFIALTVALIAVIALWLIIVFATTGGDFERYEERPYPGGRTCLYDLIDQEIVPGSCERSPR